MNLDDFSYEENDRRYINPQVSLDERNAFIDNLRNTQQTDTAQIMQDTRNLGTQVPTNLGGLSGGSNYFKARYQTPQTNQAISDLRTAAQAQALSTLMSNEIAKAKKRYNDAYRAAKKRAKGSGGGSGGSGSLSELGVDQTNQNNASKMYEIRKSDGSYRNVSREELLSAKDTAERNLRTWQATKDDWNKQNGMEQWWTADQGKHADEMISKYQQEVDELNRALGG